MVISATLDLGLRMTDSHFGWGRERLLGLRFGCSRTEKDRKDRYRRLVAVVLAAAAQWLLAPGFDLAMPNRILWLAGRTLDNPE
jgi:hypothetical protein